MTGEHVGVVAAWHIHRVDVPCPQLGRKATPHPYAPLSHNKQNKRNLGD